MTKDTKYLTRHFGTLTRVTNQIISSTNTNWDGYGFYPSPDCDGQFAMQWPFFKKAMIDAGLTHNPILESGMFLASACRYNNDPDLDKRGTTVIILKEQPGPLELTVDAAVVSGGDVQATRMQVRSPSQTLLNVPIIPQSDSNIPKNNIYRPSSWRANRVEYSIPTNETGLFKAIFASDMTGIFMPLNDLPFAQVIRRKNLGTTNDKSLFRTKISRGYLLKTQDVPVNATITSLESRNAIRVTVGNLTKWLLPQQSEMFIIADNSFIEIYGDRQAYCSIEFNADIDEPLLFGVNLDDLRKIKNLLT